DHDQGGRLAAARRGLDDAVAAGAAHEVEDRGLVGVRPHGPMVPPRFAGAPWAAAWSRRALAGCLPARSATGLAGAQAAAGAGRAPRWGWVFVGGGRGTA